MGSHTTMGIRDFLFVMMGGQRQEQRGHRQSSLDPKIPPTISLDTVIFLDLASTLVQGAPSNRGPPPDHPHRTIAAGGRHSLAIRSGHVFSWGGGALWDEGEVFVAHLGRGIEWGDADPLPAAVTGLEGVHAVEVAAGDMHSMVVGDDGCVYSAGAGWEGSLGHCDQGCLPYFQVRFAAPSANPSDPLLLLLTHGHPYSGGPGTFGNPHRTNRRWRHALAGNFYGGHPLQLGMGQVRALVPNHHRRQRVMRTHGALTQPHPVLLPQLHIKGTGSSATATSRASSRQS